MPRTHCLGPHKYKRVILDRNKYPVYKCIRCPHFVIEPMVIGRESECWKCGSTFLMSPKSLLLKPHCGCKAPSLTTEKKSKGAGMNGDKNKVLQIKPPKIKKVDSDLESAKSDIIDHLMSKLGGSF